MRVASRCSASKGTNTSKRSDRYQGPLASDVERLKDRAASTGTKPTTLAVRDHHKRSLGGKSPRKLSNSIVGLAAAGSSRYRQNIAAIPASASILPRSWH